MRALAGMAALALLAACGGGDDNALSADENAALNEAAEMLDASPDSLIAADDGLGNGEMPADEVPATGDVPATEEEAVNAQQ
jgi:hypothetical protein